MTIDSQMIQNIVVVGGFLGAALVYRKGHVPQQTIKNLEESNKSYIALDAARQVSITNLELKMAEIVKNHANEVLELNKAIADLQGQIKVYKDLPLAQLAATQQKILETLQASATTLVKTTTEVAGHVADVATELVNNAPIGVKAQE